MLNILLLLQWSDNKSTLHKTTTRRKMYFVSFCSRFIDRFAPCVLFRRAIWAHQFTVTLTCTNANETVAIHVLVVVYNKTWENRVMLTLHGQLVLDIRPRCWLRMLKLTRLRLVNFYHPQSTSLPNIQHYLIMTRWITLQYHTNGLWVQAKICILETFLRNVLFVLIFMSFTLFVMRCVCHHTRT